MYSETEIKFLTVFDPKTNERGGNTVFGRISERVKKKDADGEAEYETWNAVFCGKCFEKAKQLKDRDKINIKKWCARNHYVPEKKRSYPQILVYDFELCRNDGEDSGAGYKEDSDGFLHLDEDMYDKEMPFR